MKKRNNKEVSNLSCKAKVNPMSEKIQFEESLEDDDWGIIIGKDGTLKGMFIPEGKDEEEVPPVIVKMCNEYFGIDVTEEVTIH